MRKFLAAWAVIVLVAEPSMAAEELTISAAVTDAQGLLVHTVRSPRQAGATQIRVLAPLRNTGLRRLPVIYVLPVEANREDRYGDGLAEIQRQKLHEQYDVIFVAPTFAHLPWYADHPTDPRIRQESYLLKDVLPFVERTYPVQTDRDGRWLLGFSKSGWGAWTLLLRHPEIFSRAAAWDAPLMMNTLGQFGTTPIFGTQEQFEAYRPARLVQKLTPNPQRELRLILTGYGNFREHHTQMHALLTEFNLPHVERDGPLRKHDWHSGWVAEAVELLMADR